MEFLCQHYALLDWLAVPLSFAPRSTKNCFIYGRVNQATLILLYRKKALLYFCCGFYFWRKTAKVGKNWISSLLDVRENTLRGDPFFLFSLWDNCHFPNSKPAGKRDLSESAYPKAECPRKKEKLNKKEEKSLPIRLTRALSYRRHFPYGFKALFF